MRKLSQNMALAVVTAENHYPGVYGPFESESELTDFLDHCRKQGYETTVVTLNLPFWETPVKLTEKEF